MHRIGFVILAFVVLAAQAAMGQSRVRLASPDGEIVVTLTDADGMPTYSVAFRGEEVIGPSRLGLRFETAPGLYEDLAIGDVTRRSADIAWEQPWGEQREMREHYNEAAITFEREEGGEAFTLRVRAFDDGIGFRYEVGDFAGQGAYNITDEITEFRVDPDATAWWTQSGGYNRYEYIYEETPVRAIDRAHTPLTVRLASGTHLAIHEAALVDYSAYSLDQRRDGILKTELRPWSDGVRVKTGAEFVTPWRTVQIGAEAVDLINSHLILNLNESNALGDVSWVEPGRYVGIWWCMHINECTWGSGPKHGATTERTKRHIDFAADHGFAGVLVEGWNIGWDGDWFSNGDIFSFTEPYPDFDLEALAAYALERGVRLIGHHETSGSVTNYEDQMADAYDLYERLGITQIKTGYVADAGQIKRRDEDGIARYEWHDGQFMARHHLHAVREAAKRKISLNPHEPIKDTGLRRTYPNWITREGARGQEYNAWGYPTLNPPEHISVLAFTRMLSGPMDFTPGIFDLMFEGPDGNNRVQTTLAKQLALYVVIYSPIQMAADLPENYEARPDAFQFIKDVPVDWERSIALEGEVGGHVVIARQARGGEDWYLGAVTGREARRVEIALDFLTPGMTYTAEIYVDGEGADWETNPYALDIYEEEVTADTVLTLDLARSGGAAVRIVPVEAE